MDKSQYKEIKKELKRLGFDSNLKAPSGSEEPASRAKKITPKAIPLRAKEINPEESLFPEMPIKPLPKHLRDSILAALKGKKGKRKGRRI